MSKTNDKRQFVYLTDESKIALEEIVDYFGLQDNWNTVKKSAVINEVLVTFYDLFVFGTKSKDYQKRYFQLKKVKPQDSERLLEEVAILKRQQDVSFYTVLALFQALRLNGLTYNPDSLSSAYSENDADQMKLMFQIQSLIEKDIQTATTKKHSHKKEQRK